MASFPQRQQPQRRTTPVQPASSASASAQAHDAQQLHRNSDSPRSVASSDPQTLYFSDPISAEDADGQGTQSHPEPTPADQPRQCWICLQDESEDTPDTSLWRNPCPCALTAHEKCLLEWADDVQRQKTDVTLGKPPSSQLACPMCQAEIVLARPHARLARLIDYVDALSSRAILPTLGLGLFGSAVIVASNHGAHSIRMIFGDDDAEAILAPARGSSWLIQALRSRFPSLELPDARLDEFHHTTRLRLGLPLIPVALVASRTMWAETILPFFPVILFAVNTDESSLIQYQWPPSAALTIATLPYLRVLYGEVMDWVWTPLEKSWLKELRPPQQNDSAAAADGEADAAADDRVMQVEFQLNLGGEDWQQEQEQGDAAHNHDDDNNNQAAERERIDAADQRGDDVAAQLQDALGGRNGERNGQQQQQQRQGTEAVIDFAAMCKTVIGALLFPSISAAVGEMLRTLLPRAWVKAPVMGSGWSKKEVPTGLLQTRWGRSIIGGCLAVVLKDAVRIYCRWRMAQSHRTRKILDYDKRTGRVVDR